MDVLPIRIEHYQLPNGRRPFQDWFGGLVDEKTKSNTFIILLVGGTKRSQDSDIKAAQENWLTYQKRYPG